MVEDLHSQISVQSGRIENDYRDRAVAIGAIYSRLDQLTIMYGAFPNPRHPDCRPEMGF